MKTSFIPVDYDYFDFEGRNYARVFGRDEKGKRICIVDSCEVFFWAILQNKISEKQIDGLIEKIRKIELDTKGRNTKVEKVELHEKNFLGKPVKALKIFATNYKDLHDIADQLGMPEIEKRRGYDLGFISHYIIERKLNPLCWHEIEGEILDNTLKFGGMADSLDTDFCIRADNIKPIKKEDFSPKVLAFDIEADDLKIGKGEIVMVSLVSEDFRKVITWKGSSDLKMQDVEHVKDEAELIERFSETVRKISPDFLAGYFSDGFDLPYLKARAEANRVRLNLGVDESQPRFSGGVMPTAKVKGIVHVDLMKFIETAYSQYMSSETLALNEVANEFLGERKKEFEHRHSSKVKENDWEKYFEYNLHDSVLTYRLFEKIWPDLMEFTRITSEPVFNVSRNGMSSNVEDYILHNLNKFNEIPEKRPTYDEIGERRKREKYEGAFVFQPRPGIYEDVCIFDFTSMHASIIVTYNLSKGTLLEKKEKDCIESPEFELSGEKRKFYFSKDKSFFPSLLGEIVMLRKKYKSELKEKPDAIKKARSNAFKLLANAYYGYMGFFGARYYSVESAASTLAFVRQFNKWTMEKVAEEGYSVIFGDTDSVGFTLNRKTKEETKHFLKKLNSLLPGIMELELEDFYKRGIWVTKRTGEFGAKKKYALINHEGKLKIRGFETVRRDWCRLAREVQNNVLMMILEDGNEVRAAEYFRKIAKEVKSREVGIKNMIIRTQLKKPISEYRAISPHVIAAQKMIEREIPADMGSLIEYYIAETREKKKLVREKVKLADEKGEYNIEYYLKNQLLPAVENIFQVFGIDAKSFVEEKKQKKLSDF
jgi:DNA polymerase I/DNA polymerase-2